MGSAPCLHTYARPTSDRCGVPQTHRRSLQLKQMDATSKRSTSKTHNSSFLAATTTGILSTLAQRSVLQLAIAARAIRMRTNAKQASPWTYESTTKRKSFVLGIANSMAYASLVDAMHWDQFYQFALILGSLELVQLLQCGSGATHIQHRTTVFLCSVLRTTHAVKLIA